MADAWDFTTADYATIPLASAVTSAIDSGKWTCLFWLRSDTVASNYSNYITLQGDWRFEQGGDGYISGYCDETGSSFGGDIGYTEATTESGPPYALAWSVDATATGGSSTVYLDGSPQRTVTHPGNDNQSAFTESDFHINPSEAIDGAIGLIDFYDRPLSDSEVLAWYNGNFPTDGRLMSWTYDGAAGEWVDSITGATATPTGGSATAPMWPTAVTETTTATPASGAGTAPAASTYGTRTTTTTSPSGSGTAPDATGIPKRTVGTTGPTGAGTPTSGAIIPTATERAIAAVGASGGVSASATGKTTTGTVGPSGAGVAVDGTSSRARTTGTTGPTGFGTASASTAVPLRIVSADAATGASSVPAAVVSTTTAPYEVQTVPLRGEWRETVQLNGE